MQGDARSAFWSTGPVEEGFEVTILEARDRIGGRIHQSSRFGLPIDLGASLIHGTQGNPTVRAKSTIVACGVVDSICDSNGIWLSTHTARQYYEEGSDKIPISSVQFLSGSRSFSLSPSSSAAQAISQPSPSPTPPPKAIKPPRQTPTEPKPVPASVKLAAEIHKRAPAITETYVAYGACEKLIKECARHADYTVPQRYEKNGVIPKTAEGQDLGVGRGWWYESLGLTPTFNNWSQVTFLHMYILTVRLRAFPPAAAPSWHQHLLDHFFYAAEDRMVREHNVYSRMIRNKYLKDLFTQWRGILAAYDEGLVKGDAVLAAAVWRNVFNAQEDVDLRGVGVVVCYMRGVMQGLEAVGDEEIGKGDVEFGDPATQRKFVEGRSRMMDSLPAEEAGGGLKSK
ncbi:MAG: hypothetical protein Q9173_000087 [Seirophora scorigena]